MFNENCLLIDYSPFTQESRVYFLEEGKQQQSMTVQSDLNGLAETIVGLAYGNNNFNIKVRAPLTIINEMSRQVKDLEQSLYSENKITVEGI